MFNSTKTFVDPQRRKLQSGVPPRAKLISKLPLNRHRGPTSRAVNFAAAARRKSRRSPIGRVQPSASIKRSAQARGPSASRSSPAGEARGLSSPATAGPRTSAAKRRPGGARVASAREPPGIPIGHWHWREHQVVVRGGAPARPRPPLPPRAFPPFFPCGHFFPRFSETTEANWPTAAFCRGAARDAWRDCAGRPTVYDGSAGFLCAWVLFRFRLILWRNSYRCMCLGCGDGRWDISRMYPW